MTTTVIYADAADGNIQSAGVTYAAARDGTGVFTITDTATSFRVGQAAGGHGASNCYEGFLSFDTSPITDTDVIDAAQLDLYGLSDGSVTDFTIEARADDWGAVIDNADWVPGASLSGLTLLATFATVGFSIAGYNTFTESGSALRSWVNKTGISRLVLCSDLMTAGTAPTTDESVTAYASEQAGTTNDPKLTVTSHSAAPPTTAGLVSGVPATGELRSASLCAGSDAATLILQTGGAGGTVLCQLGAAAGTSVSRRFVGGVPYTSLYATVTGTSPVWDVEV